MDKEKHMVPIWDWDLIYKVFFFSILHTSQTKNLYAFMKIFELNQIKPKKPFHSKLEISMIYY